MKIVVLAHENDNHTAPIRWGLEQAGYKVACWGGVSWTEERQASIEFDGSAQMNLAAFALEPGDVVWIRRPNPAELHPNTAEPDKKFSEGEYRWFSMSLLYLLETFPVCCVNPYSASRFINNKSVQLVLAERCGMRVPRTLMSNTPGDVRAFLENSHHKTICKGFFPHIWKKDDSEALAVTETFEITASQLPADEVLTYAPAIYQEMVAKQFDVRMVLMGETIYSYSIRTPKGRLDWRQDTAQGLVEIETIETPPEVAQAALAFARQARLTFGSLDFAVDNDGRWWFLEINEQGQFLWLEQFGSGINIMQKFLSFLTLPEGATQEEIESRETQFPPLRDYETSEAGKEAKPEPNAGKIFVSTE